MLFNSYVFLLVFLPVAFGGYYAFAYWFDRTAALIWLVGVSLFFYGWWDINYVPLIIFSILINYSIGRAIVVASPRVSRYILVLGIGFNIALLSYFKYAGFFVRTANSVLDKGWTAVEMALPLAISFYTFQQISFLVDSRRGTVRSVGLLNYSAFIMFFPHLIAGPITHHDELIPPLKNRAVLWLSTERVSVALTIFVFGLTKKVLVADNLALVATPAFSAAEDGYALIASTALVGLLAYTLQIYFDFSGYSDMAVGLGRLFGVRLPMNFYSPYKAGDISDFWRRWHITLSRFLREYLYIPMGGNRQGALRQYANIMITMLLGGFWHGAGWTFIIWGGIHGAALVATHALRDRCGVVLKSFLPSFGLQAGTFVVVVVAWIFFRAKTVDGAFLYFNSLFGIAEGPYSTLRFSKATNLFIGALLLFVWFAPNTHQVMSRFRPSKALYPVARPKLAILQWQPNLYWAVIVWMLGAAAFVSMAQPSEFLYFQF